MKKTVIFTLIISIFLVLLIPSLAQAQDGLQVLNNSAEVEFPLKLHFNLSARSDVNITDVRLYYVIDRESYARVTSDVYIEFMPATDIDVQWALDMRKVGGLPPGAMVEYWWKVRDTEGEEVKTSLVKVGFHDNRYSWQSLTEGQVTIYWYTGEQSFSEEIMLAARQALNRLTENTGAYLSKPAKIYIYGNNQDLLGAMIYPQEWTGGVAYMRYGIIAIGISPSQLIWGKRAITHELTHLVIHQMTSNPYNELPRWLDEGLAMYNEGLLDPSFVEIFQEAIAKDALISVRSLASPFSTYAEESYLSYAQSFSLVEYLITSYGQDRMFQLLNTFKQGSNYDPALEKVYGFDMEGLNDLWREYAAERYQVAEGAITDVSPAPQIKDKGMHPTLAGVLAALATALLLLLSLIVESWAWRRGW